MIAGVQSPLSSAAVVTSTVLLVGLLAAALSNRVRRRLWRAAALLLRPGWLEPRARIAKAVSVVERQVSLGAVLRSLPPAVREAAGVEPVTVFAIDPAQGIYEPVASTLPQVSAEPIAVDQPLPAQLKHRRAVLMLDGRADDLEHASIHAVNARVIRACHAVCAVPLRRQRELIGFMLCGGTSGRDRIGLVSLARLERLGRRLSATLERVSRRSSGLPRDRGQLAGSGTDGHDERHRDGRLG